MQLRQASHLHLPCAECGISHQAIAMTVVDGIEIAIVICVRAPHRATADGSDTISTRGSWERAVPVRAPLTGHDHMALSMILPSVQREWDLDAGNGPPADHSYVPTRSRWVTAATDRLIAQGIPRTQAREIARDLASWLALDYNFPFRAVNHAPVP